MRAVTASLLIALAACSPSEAPPQKTNVSEELPATLLETGLYAGREMRTIADTNQPFTPQYPLWSDGATKRRWIYLPEGASIDASDVDAWQFPPGTKIWKEFSFGRPVETRYLERTAEGWRYATYVFSDDGATATRAPAQGLLATAQIPGGARHVIPSESDCRVCHDNGRTPVLGFSALQLSADRDPGAPHREPLQEGMLDLEALMKGGKLRHAPAAWRSRPPRIDARSPIERAALGYLHGNCGGCHRDDGVVPMVLAQSSSSPTPREDVLGTLVGQTSHFALPGEPPRARIAAGDPERSLLVARMRSRLPAVQMPPLGTQLVDPDASHLVASWIASLAERNPQPRMEDTQ